jgi:hypothetical protein|tara:strand:+ start:13950 stop:14513 length:564 start_codon:yes stop_codon:yes gene_type:complete
MNKYFILALLVFCLSCEQKSNLEIAEQFKKMEIEKTTSGLSRLLTEDAIAYTPHTTDTLTKKDILLNHEFNSSYNPWNKIISITELNDSIVEVQALETNDLLTLWELDTIGYLSRYTFSDSQISRIETDTIPNANFEYQKLDSIYNLRLAELFDWISLMYPEEYERIGELNSESSKLILQMAKEKGR